ncbi:MAG: RNA-binding cell elongation regulator Jag/EloR [Candidatus Margulisiibacteriota bacterium]
MKTIRMKGKNVEAAVRAATEVLGLASDQVVVRVINEGKGGVLGVFGGEDAEVEVVEKLSPEDTACSFLQDILDKMGLTAIAKVAGKEEDRYILDIKGENAGRIIGKDGAMLEALQVLVTTMASRAAKERVAVVIDAEGYRERRRHAIGRLVEETIRDVERLGVEKMLPPMSPADRRIVHLIVKENPKLTSFSVGERPNRRVVINLAANVAPVNVPGPEGGDRDDGEA